MSATPWMPRIDRIRCTGCGDCIELCPTGALGQVEGRAALIAPQACTYCTACEDVCPVGAITLPFMICFADDGEHDQQGDHRDIP